MSATPAPRSVATVLDEVQAALHAWHAAHPQATLYDMDVATERQLARVRAALVSELVTEAGAAEPRPVCAACGEAMQQVGRQERTVTLGCDEPLTIAGPRYRCPACGVGRSPPR